MRFFLLTTSAHDARRAGFDAQNFFSQAVPGSACEGRFKFENERIAESLIRMRESPEHAFIRRRRADEGAARRFPCRALARNTDATSGMDENRHRDDLSRVSRRRWTSLTTSMKNILRSGGMR